MRTPQAVVIYDGTCRFCQRWVDRVRRRDRHNRLEFLPFQTPDLERRFPALTRTECAESIHLLEADGTVHRGAAAGREILRRLPGWWVVALPLFLPGVLWVAERLYVWIAHRWGPLPHGTPGV